MSNDSLLGFFYWIFAMVYTFKVWGFFWFLVSIFFPVFPIIDAAVYLVERIR